MKKILGLDLGTTSIGFAHINESENYETSTIERIGVRVNPLTTDEQTNFESIFTKSAKKWQLLMQLPRKHFYGL